MWNSLWPNTPIMWEERRKHKLQSQTGPCICSATSQAGGIVLTPQENLIFFFFFLQWLEHNLSHGHMEEVTWHCSAFCNTDSVQVLGKPDILFASLRVDVWLSIGRTIFVGGKEAEVGGRSAGKFWVKSVMTEMKNSNPVRWIQKGCAVLVPPASLDLGVSLEEDLFQEMKALEWFLHCLALWRAG